MKKSYYKAIMLVLASDNNILYKEFRKIYQEYLDVDPDIKVFLVYGKDISFTPQLYDLVYDVEENYYPGMILKTVMAIQDIVDNYEFDFLIRTNISTFWDFARLKSRLNKFPKTRYVTGNFRQCIYKGIKSPQYISGVNLIMTTDLVNKIVDEKNLIVQWDLPEDWALSKFFIDRGIKLHHSSPAAIHLMEHFSYYEESVIQNEINTAKKLNHDHFRLKNKNRLEVDIPIAKLLLKEYYNKSVF